MSILTKRIITTMTGIVVVISVSMTILLIMTPITGNEVLSARLGLPC